MITQSMTRKRYNIAHRGARSLAPENTMAAFYKAWQIGAHGVETDVSVTSDGQLILFHDNTLRRTTDITDTMPERRDEPLHTFSWKEIKKLDAGSWFIETDPFGTIKNGTITSQQQKCMVNVSVPLLEELLSFVKEKEWFVNIEIKPLPSAMSFFPVTENVLQLIEKLQLEPEHFSISSFHHPFLRRVMQLRPDIEVNALIGDEESPRQDWGDFEFSVYNANVERIDARQIEKAHEHGCRINLYTVNRLEDMLHFLNSGVEKIITDFPQLLVDR